MSCPESRLGSKDDALQVKSHKYFNDIDWDKLFLKELEPPFIPQIENCDQNNTQCLTNFESKDTYIKNFDFFGDLDISNA